MCWYIPRRNMASFLQRLTCLMFCLMAIVAQAQEVVRMHKQRSFAQTVPPGDYSGIAWLGGKEYAVVCDKTNDGFLRFQIDIDTLSGDIKQVACLGKQTIGSNRRDAEDIVFTGVDSTLFICCESDNEVWEYLLDGTPTGRKLQVPEVYKKATGNYGLEALAYDDALRWFWTINESTMVGDGEQATASNGVANRLRLQAFDDNMRPLRQYCYQMERPIADKPAFLFAMGVSAITAMGDGRLMVLEREFHVPKGKLGAYANCRLFIVDPEKGLPVDPRQQLQQAIPLEKRLVGEWRTSLSLFNHAIANYEGMCFGPTLADGNRVLVMLSDSQHQYAGVLKDWFRTIVIKP